MTNISSKIVLPETLRLDVRVRAALSGLSNLFTNANRRHYLVTQEEPVRLLLGNKSDLEAKREVEKAEAAEFARTHNMIFLETSALMSHEVEYAFEVITSEILAKPGISQPPTTSAWPPDHSIIKVGEAQEVTEMRRARRWC